MKKVKIKCEAELENRKIRITELSWNRLGNISGFRGEIIEDKKNPRFKGNPVGGAKWAMEKRWNKLKLYIYIQVENKQGVEYIKYELSKDKK